MPRPILATISRSALAHNLDVARAAAPASRVWAVIKANAYGHGLQRAVAAFGNADGLAMLDMHEAVLCRELGWKKPILLLEGLFEPADVAVAARHGLTAVVHDRDQIAMLAHARRDAPLDVYLKMNTGMNRLGVGPEDYRAAHQDLRALPSIGRIGLMTHFASADGPAGVADQLVRFASASEGIAGERSLSNSAATLRFPAAHADWTRPGVMLYGASPFAGEPAGAFGLRPAMALKCRIIAVQNLARGDAIGYGGRFVAGAPMRIGIAACGFADGYPRSAPDGTPVVVGATRTRIVGQVSMDMMTVDLTSQPEAGVGTTVTLWGDDGLSVDEVARSAGTIGYELLCALAPRVPVADAT